MANVFKNISMVTFDTLINLENSLTFSKYVNRKYDKQFAKTGAKIGDTLNIRLPNRFVSSEGATITTEDVEDRTVPLVLTTQANIAMGFTSRDLTLDVDDFRNRYIKPAVIQLANRIDKDGLELAKKVYPFVGDPSVSANNLLSYLTAGATMDNNACPRDGERSAVLDPWAQAGLVNGLSGLFQSSEKIADQYEKGTMGIAAGFKFSMDQNVATHTFGTGVNDPVLVAGANQTGTELTISGLVGILNKGDMFTIPNVLAVNPVSRDTTGALQQFTVLNTTTAGATKIQISPALLGPADDQKRYQTVNALPANSAPLTLLGDPGQTCKIGICFHRDAFVLASADLYDPSADGAFASVVSDDQIGLSIRIASQWNVLNDKKITRLDCLYGWALVYPELACKVISKSGI